MFSAQGQEWVQAELDVSIDMEDAIYITATVGDGDNGNIAVDDIELLYGTCAENANAVQVNDDTVPDTGRTMQCIAVNTHSAEFIKLV